MMTLFFKGLILGVAISMPMGPISILCIQRTLAHGIKIGLCTAIGSAFADGIFGSIAAFGLNSVTIFLKNYSLLLHTIGGLALTYLGIKIILSKTEPIQHNMNVTSTKAFRAFISAFFLTLTNPITIFSFMAFFAGIGFATQGQNDAAHVFVLITGLMLGSTLWEFALSLSMKTMLYQRLSETLMKKLNFASGTILLGFAAISFVG